MSQRGQEETLFGHPVGLYTLFFAEMWERFSYYGMRAILVFYMTKDFLGLSDGDAYKVYGAYTALVYATPFIGGIVADKLLGERHAVILGGVLMAIGHLVMTVQSEWPFFFALAFLVVGNGFFKPNISTMVSSLYPPGSERRDAGFTLFYMGINLGAAIAPLVCGYVGETYGWHKGFGLATVGMVIGLCIFILPPKFNILTIGGGALSTAYGLYYISNTTVQCWINGVMAIAILSAATIAIMALLKGGLPEWAGKQPLEAKEKGLAAITPVYIGVLVAIPLVASLLRNDKFAKYVLYLFGGLAFAWLLYHIFTRPIIQRQRLSVVLILMFFSMLFWAFFEQAGTSLSNFTDRNVNRVAGGQVLSASDVGNTVKFNLSQSQLGYELPGYDVVTIDEIDKFKAEELKKAEADPNYKPEFNSELVVEEKHIGMTVNGDEIPASQFQSANPVFILVFGLLFSTLWTFLASKKMEPSAPVKFSLGLMLLGLGFGAVYMGAQSANEQGMVMVWWLVLGYLLHTTGELCISPVGLSMVSNLSPKEICSAVMGAWFMAMAFANFLAGLIAGLTGVSHGGGADAGSIPPPIETLGVYSSVFLKIGIAAVIGGFICLALSPILTKWMHADVDSDEESDS